MAVVAVTFTGTRVNSSDANTNWGNWGSGGGAPASENQLAYQGTAVNKKVTATGGSLVGIDYDPGANAVSMYQTGGSRRLWFAKVIVSDSFDLNTTYGVALGIGSSNANYRKYNVAGSGANRNVYNEYPVQGGYIITVINPIHLPYADADTGTPLFNQTDWWGAQCSLITGAAKAENLALDCIDIGQGLILYGGDGLDPDGTYQDFVDADQGTDSATAPARVGAVTSPGPNQAFVLGWLTIGRSFEATAFYDLDFIVNFKDGYFLGGDAGLVYNIENASTTITDSTLMIGNGGVEDNVDTRPDLRVEGNSGSVTLDDKTVRNARGIWLTDGASMQDATIQNSGAIDCQYGGMDGLAYQNFDGTGDYLRSDQTQNRTKSTEDATVIACVWAQDWTTSGGEGIGGIDGGSAEREQLELNSLGELIYYRSGSAATTTWTSSVSLPADVASNNNYWLWLKAEYDHSAGSVDFYYSPEAPWTQAEDVEWITLGTQQTGTAVAITSFTSAFVYVGRGFSAVNSFTGLVAYFGYWEGLPDSVQDHWFEADLRRGPDFTGSPGSRAASVGAWNWEEQGNPVYTTGPNPTAAADISGSTIIDSTSVAAVRWDVNADPDGELDNLTIDGLGTAGHAYHAIYLGKNTPSTITLRGWNVTNFSSSDENLRSTIYNNSGKAITVNIVEGTGNFSARNGIGASTTIVLNPVTITVNVTDAEDMTDVQNARVFVWPSDNTGPFPYEESVSLTRSGTTATASHTAHGLSTGQEVWIRNVGAPFDGVFSVTVTGANAYTYTVDNSGLTAGSGDCTAVLVNELTTAGGVANDTRSYTADQPIQGRVRRASAAQGTLYKPTNFSATVDKDSGVSINVQLTPDE